MVNTEIITNGRSFELVVPWHIPTELTQLYPNFTPISLGFSDSNLSEELLAQVAKIIQDLYVIESKQKIMFELIHEGLQFYPFKCLNRILDILYNTYDYKGECIYVTSATPHLKNLEAMSKLIDDNNWLYLNSLEIIFINHWETNQTEYIAKFPEYTETLNSVPNHRSKKLLCYNRAQRPSRMYVVAELIDRGLLPDSNVSAIFHINDDYSDGAFDIWFPKSRQKVERILAENRHIFPLNLSLLDDYTNYMRVMPSSIKDFDCYFALITETKVGKFSYENRNEFVLDSYLSSEKTWKIVSARLPFIIVGYPHTLEVMRELGYKTFHPFIDETYDTIEDDELRLETIMNEVSRLCSMTDDELLAWLQQIQHIVEHNRETLKNSTFKYLRYPTDLPGAK